MFKRITYIVALLLIALAAYSIFSYIHHTKERAALSFVKGKEVTESLRNDIGFILEDVMKAGHEIAKKVASNTYTPQELESLITEYALADETLLGITVAYQPYTFSDTTKLYAPYYDKSQETIILLEALYDYTDPSLETTTWYTHTQEKGAHWVAPYYGEAAKALVSDYSIPFYDRQGNFMGVVSMTISLQDLTALIHSLSLGKTGFGFITSAQGEILAHPIQSYVGRKNLTALQKLEPQPELKEAYSNIISHPKGRLQFMHEEKKQQALFFYDTVQASNWKIGVLFFTEDLLGPDAQAKRKIITIALLSSLVLFCLLGLFFNRDYLSTKEIWYLSIFGSGILLGNIYLICYLEYTSKDAQLTTESPPVTDHTTLSSIINAEHLISSKTGRPALRTIPTGVYIDELAFQDSYNVNISGVVWQKYPTAILDSISVGFKFPQASPFAEAVYIAERYRNVMDTYVLIGYDFRVTTKLNFIYKKYPFDKRNINLEIQPIAHHDRLLFVPDLDSYHVTNPSQKSGLSSNISLSGNTILESYFSYRYFTYDNTFGYSNRSFAAIPELHYNINLKRILINAFVTYLIPIFVTLIMMFIMIYASNKHKERQSDGGIVQGMTAFFFVLVFSHIDLRKNIETAELIYMEYFYFITYIMIILTTYNLILYTHPEHSIFDYKDNLIIKSVFWPSFLIMVLGISLWLFY